MKATLILKIDRALCLSFNQDRKEIQNAVSQGWRFMYSEDEEENGKSIVVCCLEKDVPDVVCPNCKEPWMEICEEDVKFLKCFNCGWVLDNPVKMTLDQAV